MAHKIKIRDVPHRNKNGTLSETKKDWIEKCQSRHKECFFEVATTRKAAEAAADQHRREKVFQHSYNHPDDRAFVNKQIGRK